MAPLGPSIDRQKREWQRVTLLRSRGRISKRKPWVADMSVTSKTSQPTFEGDPCRKCGSTVKFTKRKGTCVRCRKQWRRDNERSTRYSNSLYRSLGITRADYFRMCEDQNWQCKICEQVPAKLLVVDHCHTSGKLRGLLCPQCNSGLGFFKDDVVRMYAAIEYLRTC